jgi:quercetin dioxygenase-like cupin family protein
MELNAAKHMNWGEIPREELNPRLVRQAIHTAQMTVARLEMKAGAAVPVHHHHNAQLTMVQSGSLKFLLADGREVIVGAGEVLDLPPQAPHGVEVLEDSVVIDLFTPRRDDWISGDDAYLRG